MLSLVGFWDKDSTLIAAVDHLGSFFLILHSRIQDDSIWLKPTSQIIQ